MSSRLSRRLFDKRKLICCALILGLPGNPAYAWEGPLPAVVLRMEPTQSANFVAFNRDGTKLVATVEESSYNAQVSPFANGDLPGVVVRGKLPTLRVWDAMDGREIHSLVGHPAPISAAVFSSDGRRIVSGGVRNHRPDNPSILSRRFDPDLPINGGRDFLTHAEGGIAKVWDVESGRELLSLVGPDGPHGVIAAVSFGRGDATVEAISLDYSMSSWDGMTGRKIFTIRSDRLFAIDASPPTMAFGPDAGRAASVSRDGPFAGLNSGRPKIKLWDVREREFRALDLGEEVGRLSSIAFHPKGNRFATGTNRHSPLVWDFPSAKANGNLLPYGPALAPAKSPSGFGMPTTFVAFSPEGDYLVSGDDAGALDVWKMVTGQHVRRIATSYGPIRAMTFKNNTIKVATGGKAGRNDIDIRIWEFVFKENAINS